MKPRFTRIALSGCGWLLSFHWGVLAALKPKNAIVYGTSGGSIIAAGHVAGIPVDHGLDVLCELSEAVKASPFHGFGQIADIVREGMAKELTAYKDEETLLNDVNTRLRFAPTPFFVFS